MASGNPLAFIQPPNSTTFAGGLMETNWTANPEPKPKKTSLGRRKIPIRKIEDKNKKHVTFSKRRKGLFSKARELCILCGASVAIITFSEAGKAFSFGHPSTDSVIDRYLHGGSGTSSSHPQFNHDAVIQDDDRRLFWWDRSVEQLGLEDLEAFAASLEKLRSNVHRRIGDLHELDQLEPTMAVKNEIEYLDDLIELPGMASGGNQNYWNNINGVVGDGDVDPNSFDWSDFVDPLPSQDREVVHQLQDHQYQSGFGCMGVGDGDIRSIVAGMAGFNSNGGFSSRFGEL